MGAQNTTTVNFGAFPGPSEAEVVVTGQTGILADSLVEARIWPVATADHSEDEHICEAPSFEVVVPQSSIVPGTGFTIRALWRPRIQEKVPDESRGARANYRYAESFGPRTYGQWTVFWVWN